MKCVSFVYLSSLASTLRLGNNSTQTHIKSSDRNVPASANFLITTHPDGNGAYTATYIA